MWYKASAYVALVGVLGRDNDSSTWYYTITTMILIKLLSQSCLYRCSCFLSKNCISCFHARCFKAQLPRNSAAGSWSARNSCSQAKLSEDLPQVSGSLSPGLRNLGFWGLGAWFLVSMQSVERRNLLVTKVVDFAHQAGCHLWLLLQVASWASRARTRRGGGRTRRGRSGVLEAVAAICVKLG